jgi:predicted TPR repeat methyltransferase
MAQLIHQPGRLITGVDLSPRMLAKAAERNVYTTLVQSEIHRYFETVTQTFDAIIAADVLVYIGDLQDFFAGSASCLASGGHLIFSVETTQKSDFEVLPSGRFAHHLEYLQRLGAGHFSLDRIIPTNIRRDTIGFATGAIVFMRRTDAN